MLDNVQALLSVSSFIAVIQELLQDDELRVRRKALEVFTARVQVSWLGSLLPRLLTTPNGSQWLPMAPNGF